MNMTTNLHKIKLITVGELGGVYGFYMFWGDGVTE